MTQANLGSLYLIPTPLDFGCADTSADIRSVLPQSTIAQAANLQYWVVENAKSARAFLKRVHALQPLTCSLQDMHITQLPRAAHHRFHHGVRLEAPVPDLKQLHGRELVK